MKFDPVGDQDQIRKVESRIGMSVVQKPWVGAALRRGSSGEWLVSSGASLGVGVCNGVSEAALGGGTDPSGSTGAAQQHVEREGGPQP
jgi:hypothetical protein